ncbi:stalk domain-containing protein [Paenibacillus xerothermodurans]|uniref:Copper amine oxidase-like N-terminal domain-containing protein n=1 Tax=Paenibacillus xerothermodurans TaxID=1977292 RepID=A0A2W1NJ73_PAEXE|nr:hypothetical protein [Paenibacillus xerothermodurans]PZE19575.1 hypothetical protein CBW46_017825 [Paenibacillus xerothermodurans]
MKRAAKIALLALTGVTLLSGGAYAGANSELIQAYLNHSMTFKVDGKNWTPIDQDGNRLYPIVYNGSSYLPVRALGTVVGASVGWDEDTSTILIARPGTAPVLDTPPTAPPPVQSTNSTNADDGVEKLKLDENYSPEEAKRILTKYFDQTLRDYYNKKISAASLYTSAYVGSFQGNFDLGDSHTLTGYEVLEYPEYAAGNQLSYLLMVNVKVVDVLTKEETTENIRFKIILTAEDGFMKVAQAYPMPVF